MNEEAYFGTKEEVLEELAKCSASLEKMEQLLTKLQSILTTEQNDSLQEYVRCCRNVDDIIVRAAYHVGFKHGRMESAAPGNKKS